MPDPFSEFATSEDAEDAFYDALRNGDPYAVMQVWAQEDEIVCIHPNGPRLQGWNAIESSWESILERGGIEVEALKQVCTVSGAIAVHNVIEEITIPGDQQPEVIHCFATNVYIHDPSGWQMVMHHSAPAGEETSVQSSAGAVLH
ncbi:MAG: nuclear transport factor 2 family protein [Burkholderiaceae bacterium]